MNSVMVGRPTGFSRRFNFSILLILSFLVLPSCRAEVDSVRSELAPPLDVNVLYLEEVISPCIPLWNSSHEPCLSEVVNVESYSGSRSMRWPDFSNWTSFLLGDGDFTLAVHLVVRGEARFDTTRCEAYPRRLGNYWYHMVPETDTYVIDFMENSGLDYRCYIDIGIKEYIVGSGPPVLTISIHRESIDTIESDLDFNEWPEAKKDKWVREIMRSPQSRVANAYEGKELLLFLGIPATITVESFEVSWPIAGLWFVQKVGDEIRAVSQGIEYAQTEEERGWLDLLYDDLVEKVKRAATERATLTDGRIGLASFLPLLIKDANLLRDYYISEGAVYDGSEEATVLPPPVPGEGDIVSTPADG